MFELSEQWDPLESLKVEVKVVKLYFQESLFEKLLIKKSKHADVETLKPHNLFSFLKL